MNPTTRGSRRHFLRQAAALPTAFAPAALATRPRNDPAAAPKSLPAPRYTLSVNLELMFPGAMPYEERLRAAISAGAKAYSFWGYEGKELDRLRALQDKHGLTCASISGANKTGWNTGLTKMGFEKAFLDDFTAAVGVAKRLGVPNLITFVGATQNDIPWEVQYAQIVAGLKKAGDIAGEAGVFLTLEPLNAVESPQMSVNHTGRAFAILRDVAHPHVKLDFDLYHRQLGEGNLVNTLKEGLAKDYVRFVEVGDVPGRFEPGTGETNYRRLFDLLREVGYAGFIGMEHRASRTPKQAFDAVRRLAGLA